MLSGNKFQTMGPATAKDRRPSVVRWCRVRQDGDVGLIATADDQQDCETGDQDAAVGQVMRRFVVQTPVNCRREFKLDPIDHIEPMQVDM